MCASGGLTEYEKPPVCVPLFYAMFTTGRTSSDMKQAAVDVERKGWPLCDAMTSRHGGWESRKRVQALSALGSVGGFRDSCSILRHPTFNTQHSALIPYTYNPLDDYDLRYGRPRVYPKANICNDNTACVEL